MKQNNHRNRIASKHVTTTSVIAAVVDSLRGKLHRFHKI